MTSASIGKMGVAGRVPPASPGVGPTVESFSGTGPTSTASVILPVPSGTQDGDILIALFANDTSRDVNTSAGWSLVRAQSSGGSGSARATVFSRVASSEPADYTWTLNASATVSAFCIRVSGSSGVAASSGYGSTDNLGTWPIAGVTSTVDNSLIVALLSQRPGDAIQDNAVWSTITELSERNNDDITASIATRILATAGFSGDHDVTTDVSFRTAAVTIALSPTI